MITAITPAMRREIIAEEMARRGRNGGLAKSAAKKASSRTNLEKGRTKRWPLVRTKPLRRSTPAARVRSTPTTPISDSLEDRITAVVKMARQAAKAAKAAQKAAAAAAAL